jgi:D-aminoacyl-tRNA deacylase
MRVVIQRVLKANVRINNSIERNIRNGLVIFVGIEDNDDSEDIKWLVKKILNLRIFNDENGVMNRSLIEIDGELMVISQFTLHASTKKGNRPSYMKASKPDFAIPLYLKFIQQMEIDFGKNVNTGEFGADMKVELINDGPVTILMDTKNKE